MRDAFGPGAYPLNVGQVPPLPSASLSDPPVDAVCGEAVQVGGRLGDFEVLGEIGRGGMGVVHRARQVSLNRTVALKILSAFADSGHTAVSRFRKEAQAAGRLHHTNIVSVYAQGEHGGHYYYAMELIEGDSLDVAVKRGAFRQSSSTSASRQDYHHVARVMAEVADALEYAHQSGVIHRDVKPQNLLLARDGRLHITDFGLARLLHEPHLTVTGEVLGTPSYMSPEQVRLGHGQVDWRTDIYSLGATLYETLTRQRPYGGETRDQVIDQVCTEEPRPLRRIDARIPIDLETVCLRAMEKNRLRRYQSASDMAEDLRRFADGRPILSRRTSRIAKVVKWMRRHKAASTTIASLIVIAILSAGLTWKTAITRRDRMLARHAHANRLLQEAYEQLAFSDYSGTEETQEKIDQADAMGADPVRVHLVRALWDANGQDREAAIAHANAVLERFPDHIEALCIRAITEHLANDDEAARRSRERVRALGGPQTATEWFFYGIAVHYTDPRDARDSYLQALRLHGSQNEMYPQAIVHLARAQNQLMYRTREIEGFDDATQNLKNLIRAGLYDSYPHYLLSIANRLGAEIAARKQTPEGDDLARRRYEDALQAARNGQEKNPQNDRPVTAEAECLESMGNHEAAIGARTRAIRLSEEKDNVLLMWEGYHYRWRLYYCQSRLDEALDDLEKLAAFDPGNVCYAHVYPALVRAEMGDIERALATVRRIADKAPYDPIHLIWASSALRIFGRPEDADALLAGHRAVVDFAAGHGVSGRARWLQRLYECCQGRQTVDELAASIKGLPDARTREAELCFHAAALDLAAGRRDEAVANLERSYESFDSESGYTYHARTLLIKLRDESWPPWQVTAADPRADEQTDRP